MLHNIFILTKSGINIFYKAYTPEACILNQVMVSAFFSAMFSFSNNLTGQALDFLRVGDRQFVVEESPDLLFITLTDNDDSITEIRERLIKLKDFFYKNYAKYIDKKTFDGNIEPFEGIEPNIDEIILRPPILKRQGKVLETLKEIKKLINIKKKGTKAKLNNFLDEVINNYEKELD